MDSVRTGSPAQVGGLRAGDRIFAVDGNLVPDARVAIAALRSRRPGSTVVLTVGRGNGRLHLPVRPTVSRALLPADRVDFASAARGRMRRRRAPTGRAPRAGRHTGLEGWAAVGERGGQARGERRPRT
ncbi:PDZ domain-containing protein [Streptomyces sp. SID4946]|nr:PDZ domain-containing protein [Streptomyces sp. CRPSP2-6A1]MYQ96515.1 PDZ domain-containing protein [Streptomyces sp. SID4946]